jgi:hypothetical protein
MAKWYEIVREIDEIVTADCEDGTLDWRDEDASYEYAHEWADGSQYVIWHAQSREAWLSGADEWEDEATDFGPFDSIQSWITATVYCAMKATILDAVYVYRQDHEDDDEDEDDE